MKNIVSRKDFLRENVSDHFDMQEYDILKNKILEIIGFGSSFRNYDFVREGNIQYEEFLKELKEDNIDIDYFMKTYKDKIYNDPDLTDKCGVLDILLYNYDDRDNKHNHPLSGERLIDGINDWSDEAIIKYKYGYHLLSLGKKYLYQSYDNLSEFYEQCAREFPRVLFEGYVYDTKGAYNNWAGTPLTYSEDFDKDVYKYSLTIEKNNSMIVVIDLKDLCKDGKIKASLEKVISNIQYKECKIYENGALVAGFGDPQPKLSDQEEREALEQIKINLEAEKYNL